MTLAARPWRTTRALTVACSTSGDPMINSLPSCASKTRSKTTSALASPAMRSRRRVSPSFTFRCRPLASMTAYMEVGSAFQKATIQTPNRTTRVANASNATCPADGFSQSIYKPEQMTYYLFLATGNPQDGFRTGGGDSPLTPQLHGG